MLKPPILGWIAASSGDFPGLVACNVCAASQRAWRMRTARRTAIASRWVAEDGDFSAKRWGSYHGILDFYGFNGIPMDPPNKIMEYVIAVILPDSMGFIIGKSLDNEWYDMI